MKVFLKRGSVFCAFLLFGLIPLCAIAHDHGHSHEAPHLKYTKEVNEAARQELDDEEDHHSHHGHSHDHHECPHSHSHSHSHEEEKPKIVDKPAKTNGKQRDTYLYDEKGHLSFMNDPNTRLWVYAVGSTLLISAVPCLLLTFIPIQANVDSNSTLLKILLAFGAGGLLGDAFLHLIPHALPAENSHSHSHSHGGSHSHEPHDLSVGGGVLLGFITFFVVEKFVRIVRKESGQSHGHSHGPAKDKIEPKKSRRKNKDKDSDVSQGEDADFSDRSPERQLINESPQSSTKIAVAAFLNLVADFMHNFTDGLAIGASYIAGSTVGLVTMVTVLVHEVPHEIGDFAILVQAGFSKKKAILIQLVTALGALTGCIISLWSVDASALAEAAEQSLVLPFTAGGFIYIASSSIIPELLEDSKFLQSIGEVIAILFGIFMMYLIALYE